MQARQARRNTQFIAPHHEQNDDTQARQAGRNAQITAPNDEQDDDSETETARSRRTIHSFCFRRTWFKMAATGHTRPASDGESSAVLGCSEWQELPRRRCRRGGTRTEA
ncbi:hypothetical protein BCR37DRAFT_377727 [Protomyces lactucae-debilis]|uniref:Uncharacterized protein n=1 Tax=Protomyces lactucae-debilis TaxID=2754530 RepID=A0A1Y2FNV7_PROLT|nr:uncharacterized protein BCR37DRAFT_377727 [Protomyces lactucae-debilis]ORY84896.1 hypothetical protein BCR37DRAFT_377727 [Protomyces lactucae-debilis]